MLPSQCRGPLDRSVLKDFGVIVSDSHRLSRLANRVTAQETQREYLPISFRQLLEQPLRHLRGRLVGGQRRGAPRGTGERSPRMESVGPRACGAHAA